MHAYLIILEIAPLKVGRIYDSLPLHCTLVHWFWAGVSPAELTRRLQKTAAGTGSIEIHSGQEATFTGVTKTGTIPVTVNKVKITLELQKLHIAVCDELDKMQARYSVPEYVKQGFNPHVTHQGETSLEIGKTHESQAIYLVEADAPEYGNDRRVVSKIAINS